MKKLIIYFLLISLFSCQKNQITEDSTSIAPLLMRAVVNPEQTEKRISFAENKLFSNEDVMKGLNLQEISAFSNDNPVGGYAYILQIVGEEEISSQNGSFKTTHLDVTGYMLRSDGYHHGRFSYLENYDYYFFIADEGEVNPAGFLNIVSINNEEFKNLILEEDKSVFRTSFTERKLLLSEDFAKELHLNEVKALIEVEFGGLKPSFGYILSEEETSNSSESGNFLRNPGRIEGYVLFNDGCYYHGTFLYAGSIGGYIFMPDCSYSTSQDCKIGKVCLDPEIFGGMC